MNRTKWRSVWKRITIVAVITVICTLTFVLNLKGPLHCFELPGNKLPELEEDEPPLGSAIYFHETSCPNDLSDITVSARQSCSIESALRAHPNTDVFLLISSPILKPLQETDNVFIQQLLSYQNFKLKHITFSKYLSNTPLNKIYKSGALNSSEWPVQHSSDVLRYATLYKFGGIYLDLDVIVLKPLTKLRNFAVKVRLLCGNVVGAESNTSLGSGILGFSYDRTGREVATHCAEELAETYKAEVWGFNGPGVITRVMEKRCRTTEISKMIKSFCEGFQIYPTDYFQAISFNEPQIFFQEGNTEKVMELLNQSYTIHYWNKMSSSYVLDNRRDIPYLNYAKKYCPKVYNAAKGNFNS